MVVLAVGSVFDERGTPVHSCFGGPASPSEELLYLVEKQLVFRSVLRENVYRVCVSLKNACLQCMVYPQAHIKARRVH